MNLSNAGRCAVLLGVVGALGALAGCAASGQVRPEASARSGAAITSAMRERCADRDTACVTRELVRIWQEGNWDERGVVLQGMDVLPDDVRRAFAKEAFGSEKEPIARGALLGAWLKDAKSEDLIDIVALLTDDRCAGRGNSTVGEIALEFLVNSLDYDPDLDVSGFISSREYRARVKEAYLAWLTGGASGRPSLDAKSELYCHSAPSEERIRRHANWVMDLNRRWGELGGLGRPVCPN